jgi:ankyrin repeat protein
MDMKLGKLSVAGCAAKAMNFISKFKPNPDGVKPAAERQKELNHALLKAVVEGKDQEFERLLNAGADIHATDIHGRTALIFAASHGNSRIARILTERIDNREYVDAADELGRTALIYAAAHGDTTICVMLLKKGADMATTDYESKTAVMWARENGHIGTEGLLMDVEGMDSDERRAYLSNLM